MSSPKAAARRASATALADVFGVDSTDIWKKNSKTTETGLKHIEVLLVSPKKLPHIDPCIQSTGASDSFHTKSGWIIGFGHGCWSRLGVACCEVRWSEVWVWRRLIHHWGATGVGRCYCLFRGFTQVPPRPAEWTKALKFRYWSQLSFFWDF